MTLKTTSAFFKYLLFGCLFTVTTSLLAQSKMVINPAAAGFSKERLARLDAFLDKEIVAGNIPGAVSLIYRKGAVAQHKTHGYSSLATKEKMALDEIFYIQSMTKPIVSVGIMMLYEEGYFELNDPISKYFPAFENMSVATFVEVAGSDEKKMELTPADKPITIAHCLSHTAGFSHGLGRSEIDQMYLKTLYFQPHKTIEDRVMAMAKLPLVAQPDNVWYYSAAPDVLSLLIEHFTGQSCADYLEEKIFKPLGMEDTGYNVAEAKNDRIVTLHHKNKAGILEPFTQRQPVGQGNTVFGGTHALFSTASDYLKFCQMLMNNGKYNGQQFLGRKTIELMTADRVGDKLPGAYGFGLGFGVKTDLAASGQLATEGVYYWSGAFCTYFFIDPEEELISLLMMQIDPYSDFYNRKFRQLVYQAIVD